ncbi:uncharacterized protein LOC111050403 isoform X3 [Nilaparvata lugens]|uniref:uncharacterized protein LOC111050403 isoform X3 n=1 Tax=Nilaparvata lugens TaxID=108931 RepID=UPI00193DC320|nr:uncharacterized protein LOC111050403 isoform X3 [Nilaparvata lugens]
MKGIVLCAVLIVSLAVNQSYGAAVDLSFLHDTNFPGNPGFNANINKYVQSTIDNAMASANAQAATGYTGSNVVTPTVVTSTIGGKISQPRFPKIKPIKPPKYVKPVVKPRTPLWKPTPVLTTPVTTFVGDKERNIMTNMQNSNLGGNVVINPIVQTITDDGKLITTTPSMINGKPILPGVPNPITTVVNGVQGEIIPSTTLTPTILPEVSVTGTTDLNGIQRGIMNDLKFENLGNNGNEHVVISPVVQSPGLKVNENGDVDFS